MEDICLALGEGARFLVRRGFAKELDKPGMLARLQKAHALGHAHGTDSVREQPSFFCNCCRCRCALMAGVQVGFTGGIAKTPFLAEIAGRDCDYCGECLKTCIAKCIGLADDARAGPRPERYAEVHAAVCLGCGACLDACERSAIRLVPRPSQGWRSMTRGWRGGR